MRFWWQDLDVKATLWVTFLEFVLRWSKWRMCPCWHCTKARRRDPGHRACNWKSNKRSLNYSGCSVCFFVAFNLPMTKFLTDAFGFASNCCKRFEASALTGRLSLGEPSVEGLCVCVCVVGTHWRSFGIKLVGGTLAACTWSLMAERLFTNLKIDLEAAQSGTWVKVVSCTEELRSSTRKAQLGSAPEGLNTATGNNQRLPQKNSVADVCICRSAAETLHTSTWLAESRRASSSGFSHGSRRCCRRNSPSRSGIPQLSRQPKQRNKKQGKQTHSPSLWGWRVAVHVEANCCMSEGEKGSSASHVGRVVHWPDLLNFGCSVWLPEVNVLLLIFVLM